jgi:hypothetical protein
MLWGLCSRVDTTSGRIPHTYGILQPLNDLIRHPRAGWRDDFVKFSKNEPIDSIYREYQHGDEPGYEHDCSRDEPHDEDAWDEYLIGEEPEGA